MMVRPRRLSFLLGFALVALLVVCVVPASAQSHFEVTGTVVDSVDVGLQGATVVVMQQADSTLVSFGITRGDGAFRLTRVPAGEFVLQVTFVGFTPHTRPITISDASVDVGRIRLDEATAELDELVVTAFHVPMVVKRDTLEYNAAAFRVPLGANVEELLRRLPGIEVERDGTIRAQGEEVRQVLVDGREFFGNDPTVATRNLPADAVDRVQVYDRRSDAAEFTGVDDGQEERTINLALRPDRRRGYFGTATGGIGGSVDGATDALRFDGRANVNRFAPSTQLSLITNTNNINHQGFSISDAVGFMGGPAAMMAAGGRMSLGNLPISQGMGDGLATTLSGGINLNHEFTPNSSVRASYIGHYLDQAQDRSIQQWQLAGGGGAAFSDQQVDQLNESLSHRLNLNASHTFSEGHDVRLRSNFQMNDGDLSNWSTRQTWDGADRLQNANLTDYRSTNSSLSGDATLTYRQRLAPGRTVTAELRSSLNDGDSSDELRALSEIYQDGNLLTTEELAQLQSQLNNTFTHSQRFTYTEPLGLRQLLQFEVQHRAVTEDRDRSVYDIVDGATNFNPDLSSAFERTHRYYQAGASFRRAVEPLTLSFGVNVQRSELQGSILHADAEVDRGFVHILPQASVQYALAQQRNVELRYNASTREPSMRDLQPFADNSDPLNIFVGNPDLRPEYSHSVLFRFTMFDPFTMTNLFAFLRGSYTFDRIVSSRTIDEFMRQTVTRQNADGDWSLSATASFGTPVRPLGLRLNASTNAVYNRSVEFINGEANNTNILRGTLELRFENRDKDVVDAMLGARVTYNDVRYALNPNLNRSYANPAVFTELGYQATESLRLSTGLDYRYYSGRAVGDAQHVPLLKAEVSQAFMSGRLQLILEGHDLLNQNVGVNFTNTSAYIQEELVNNLGRYVMLRMQYNLTGSAPSGRGGGIRMAR